eukprot:234132_1
MLCHAVNHATNEALYTSCTNGTNVSAHRIWYWIETDREGLTLKEYRRRCKPYQIQLDVSKGHVSWITPKYTNMNHETPWINSIAQTMSNSQTLNIDSLISDPFVAKLHLIRDIGKISLDG